MKGVVKVKKRKKVKKLEKRLANDATRTTVGGCRNPRVYESWNEKKGLHQNFGVSKHLPPGINICIHAHYCRR